MTRNDDHRQSFAEADCKIGELRRKDDLYPYASGRGDELIIHTVERMVFHHVKMDRALWAIETTQGRIIVAMQQFEVLLWGHFDNTKLTGEIELHNAPFRDTAIKGVGEDILDLRALRDALNVIPGLM